MVRPTFNTAQLELLDRRRPSTSSFLGGCCPSLCIGVCPCVFLALVGKWPNLYCWSIKWELTFRVNFYGPCQAMAIATDKTQTHCVSLRGSSGGGGHSQKSQQLSTHHNDHSRNYIPKVCTSYGLR